MLTDRIVQPLVTDVIDRSIDLSRYGFDLVISPQRVVKSYRNKALLSRKSSDNSNLDIDFQRGELDTTQAGNFAGSGDLLVPEIYNQGIGNYTITQSNASYQSAVVRGGVVNKVNGKVAFKCDYTKSYTSNVNITVPYFSITVVLTNNFISSDFQILYSTSGDASGNFIPVIQNGVLKYSLNGTLYSTGFSTISGKEYAITYEATQSGINVYVNATVVYHDSNSLPSFLLINESIFGYSVYATKGVNGVSPLFLRNLNQINIQSLHRELMSYYKIS